MELKPSPALHNKYFLLVETFNYQMLINSPFSDIWLHSRYACKRTFFFRFGQAALRLPGAYINRLYYTRLS